MLHWNKYILFVVLGIILTFTWIGLEYTLDGLVTPQHSDSIFLVILTYLITEKVHDKLK